jgi:hypothetical protein
MAKVYTKKQIENLLKIEIKTISILTKRLNELFKKVSELEHRLLRLKE